MPTTRTCPECGAEIPADAPEGLCPRCLAGLAASPPTAAGEGELDGAHALPIGQFPQFELLGTLGRGGMSVVYRARQPALNRVVALKVISPGMVSEEVIRRFRLEAEALGRLQHPGIARIYEYGTVESAQGPQPYFVLECIAGPDGSSAPTLTAYAEERDLDIRARLALIEQVAGAVHHAHQKGVIHRDLKPANILVDEAGQPKVLDFGVARLTDSDLKAVTLRTDLGQLIGTLPYMSPEQASGDPAELDTRSDVYALGVIAYELLCGRLPFALHRHLIHEAVRVIREEEPTRLSALNRALSGDVETIVLKSLAKEKERRYQSAEELATDIRRYLCDEPIDARRSSIWYQLRKYARRNRAWGLGIAAVFAALLTGAAATSWQALRAARADGRADEQPIILQARLVAEPEAPAETLRIRESWLHAGRDSETAPDRTAELPPHVEARELAPEAQYLLIEYTGEPAQTLTGENAVGTVQQTAPTVAPISRPPAAPGIAGQKPVVVHLGTIAPNGSTYHCSLQTMAEQWRDISGGTVRVVVHPGGVLGGDSEMVQLMRGKSLQAALLTAKGLVDIEPAVAGLQSMPLRFRNLEEFDYVNAQLRPAMARSFESKDFVILSWMDAGWVRYFSKDPVTYPDDLKSRKVFAWDGDPQHIQLMGDLGLNPIPLDTGGIQTGLRTGLIDVVAVPPIFALAGRIDQQAPEMQQAWDKMAESDLLPRVRGAVVPADTYDEVNRLLLEYRSRPTVGGE